MSLAAIELAIYPLYDLDNLHRELTIRLVKYLARSLQFVVIWLLNLWLCLLMLPAGPLRHLGNWSVSSNETSR